MELTANARTVLEARYLRRENGQIVETPEELFRRVARNIAAVDGEVYGKDPDRSGRWRSGSTSSWTARTSCPTARRS